MIGLTVHPSTRPLVLSAAEGSPRTVKPCLLSRLKWVAQSLNEYSPLKTNHEEHGVDNALIIQLFFRVPRVLYGKSFNTVSQN